MNVVMFSGELTSRHLLGILNSSCHGDPWEEGVNGEFQVSDITAPSTGTCFLLLPLLHGAVKPETEHVFHMLLRQRQ